MSGVTRTQFDRYSALRSRMHQIPFQVPAGTDIQAANWAKLIGTKTDLRLAPASTSVAGTATAVTSVSAATDLFTLNSHGYQPGQVLQVSSSGAIPAPLAASTNYYVVSVTTNTFGLSLSLDGPLINLTDAGSGTISMTIPAGYPWIFYRAAGGVAPLFLPINMSIICVCNDAAGNDLSVTCRVSGQNQWGQAIRNEIVGPITSTGAVTTGIQTLNAYRAITLLEVLSVGTAAAGDVFNAGLSNGLNSAIATSPRANFAVPVEVGDLYQGAVKYIMFGTNATANVSTNPTINLTYGTVQTPATAGFDGTTTQGGGFGFMVLDPNVVK